MSEKWGEITLSDYMTATANLCLWEIYQQMKVLTRKMSLDNSHIRHHLILLTLVLHTFFFFLCKGSSLHLLNREPLKLWHHFMTSVATYFTYFFYDTSRPLHYMNRRWTFLVQSTFLFQKNLMWNPILPLTCY